MSCGSFVYATLDYDTEATVSFYDTSTVSAADLIKLDCSTQRNRRDIPVSIDHCVYGNHLLVNNFQITRYPTCANGAKAVIFFYATTSCTGTPTFRSDETDVDITDRCLFGSSPDRWSMIFKCENLESQALGKYSFFYAALPRRKSNSFQDPIEYNLEPTDAVVTPYESNFCTVYNPKEPTFLPVDTCLSMEDSHSILVTQRAVCANGKLAWIHTYTDSNCSAGEDMLRAESYSRSQVLAVSMDKHCHPIAARSIAYVCKDHEMKKFEDLPPYKFKDVEPLLLLDRPVNTIKPTPVADLRKVNLQETGNNRQNNWQSVVWDGSKWIKKPQGHPIYLPSKPQGGTIITYNSATCNQDERRYKAPEIKAVDTCILVNRWKGLQVTSRPMCENMTSALVATYSSPGCRPENMKSLGDIPKVYRIGCGDISDIGSMAFWCDGLPADQISPPSNGWAVFKLVAIIIGSMLGFMVLMATVVALILFLNGRKAMADGEPFWERFRNAVLRPFGKKEGMIRL